MVEPLGAPLRIGVVGAGRVGASLAAALRSAGHDIVAAAGESEASRGRAASMLPGVPLAKPTAVARASDLLLLTVPDDMLGNVVAMLSAAGAIREGQYVAHTSGAHGLAILAPAAAVGARPLALHPAMTFTGTPLDLERLAGCVFGVTADPAEQPYAERLVADLAGRVMWVPEERRALYHAALAHGANHLVTLVAQAMELLTAAGADASGTDGAVLPAGGVDAAATLRPLLTAALDNALRCGDAALTGPIVRGDVNTVSRHVEEIEAVAPHVLPSYVVLAGDTLDRVVRDGRVLPIRAAKIRRLLDRGRTLVRRPSAARSTHRTAAR